MQSGNKIITDAPVDNKGKGEFFSPTDMVSAALASCIFTIMGIEASQRGFVIDGAIARTTKIMASDPRRIDEIRIEYDFSMLELSSEQQKVLNEITATCPVCLSVHPDLRKVISIKF